MLLKSAYLISTFLCRYKDLMSHEDVYGNLDELEDDEEAIYEDLYNHIMPLPSPFNLVEYEVM